MVLNETNKRESNAVTNNIFYMMIFLVDKAIVQFFTHNFCFYSLNKYIYFLFCYSLYENIV